MTAATMVARKAMERAGPLPPVCLPIPWDLLPTYTGGENLHDIIDAAYRLAVTFCQVAVGRYRVQPGTLWARSRSFTQAEMRLSELGNR
jgi:hypothetical protein